MADPGTGAPRPEGRSTATPSETLTIDRPPGGPGGPPAPPEAGDGKGTPGKEEGRRSAFSFLRELPVLVVIAFVLALLIKTFLVQAFYIPSESMLPTLEVGDRVLVNKLVYHFHEPRRGDIVVFAEPHPGAEPHRNWWQAFTHWLTDGLGVTQDPTKDYIKRVIGLPGETVEVHRGVVTVNGKRLTEPYLSPIKDLSSFEAHKVPAGSIFVMGDNRANSQDSRSLLGDIPLNKVIGKAFVVIWPPSSMKWLPGT